MSVEQEKLLEFLREIQLEQFFYLVVKNLHVTRLAHFDHVEEIDLTGIGMSKPEQRRLFDHLKKAKRPSLKKLFRKSFRKDTDKKHSISPPKEAGTSFDEGNCDQQSINDPTIAARNTLQQGLKCLIQQKDLVLGEFLGKGAFGFVRKGVWTTDKGAQLNVAVKCLKPNQDEATVMLQGEFIKEANAMSKLDHPNLIRLYGIVLTTPMMLVTELAPVGSLLNRLRKEPHKFMISILCSLVVQIVSGMKYLQMKRFIHRDLAARNILLVSYEKIKIGDFGLMRALPSDADYYVMQPTGLVPFAWCATECLKYRRFSHASDVWAFGVTLLEIFSYGQEPWPSLSGAEILERIDAPNFMRPDRPDHCPLEIYKIVKHYCWNHSPEQRASFEALEKMILKVLPKETNALGDYYPVLEGELPFKKGDPLTIIEASHDPSLVKAQNRRNGKVGVIPIQLLSSTGLKSPDIKAHHLSLDFSKNGKAPNSEHGRSLEPDSFSVVSHTSSSSSCSNSSSEYPSGHHSLTFVHSTPKDIPVAVKRQSTTSSGIGSGGPSLASSYKEDVILPSVSESDYGSQDDSVSLTSRKSTNTRVVVDDTLSNCTYENTTIGRRSVSPQDRIVESPIKHSNPITIPRHGYEVPQIFTIPKDTNTYGCPHLHIVSLPCRNSENSEHMSDSIVSSEIEFDNTMSCSAPTTKTELKTVQCTQQKPKVDDAGDFSPGSSFGTCKQRQNEQNSAYQLIDNMVYERMGGGETYETMKHKAFPHKEVNTREAYENIEISVNPLSISDSDSLTYENVVICSKEEENASETPPPLLPRNPRCSENTVPLPARTYRDSTKQRSRSSGYPHSVSIYENSVIDLCPGAKSELENRMKLPPKTYKKTIGNYENTDLCLTISFLSKPSYENCKLNYVSNSDRLTIDRPCQRDEAGTTRESICHEIDSTGSDGPPPPLPKKKSNRYKIECSLLSNKTENCSPSMSPVVDQCTIEQTASIPIEQTASIPIEQTASIPIEQTASIPIEQTASCLNENSTKTADTFEKEELGDDKRNLIDDSPVHKSLPLKYGMIWNGEEISGSDINETPENQPVSGGPEHIVPCEELVAVPNSNVSGQGEATRIVALDEAHCIYAEDRGLLRALLSPTERRNPLLMRAQSEECPVPPPRKRRGKQKTSRRHTLGELVVKNSISVVEEVLFQTDIDKKCGAVAPETSSVPLTKEPSLTKPCGTDSESQRLENIDNCENSNIESERTSLPPAIASDIKLQREDSDFVDIEMEEAQSNNGMQSTCVLPCADSLSLKEKPLSSGGSSSKCEETVEGSSVDKSETKGKSEIARSRFSKIKSLLSGKVSCVDEATPLPAEVATGSVEGKEAEAVEEDFDNERKEDTGDDETRYVLHFVTPV